MSELSQDYNRRQPTLVLNVYTLFSLLLLTSSATMIFSIVLKAHPNNTLNWKTVLKCTTHFHIYYLNLIRRFSTMGKFTSPGSQKKKKMIMPENIFDYHNWGGATG